MLDVIAQNLVPAITIAVSPMPLIALIVLMVAGSRAAAVTWAVGWFLTTATLFGIGAATASATPAGDIADNTGVNYLAFAVAALFLWLSWRALGNRPAPGMQAEEPPWLTALASMSLPKVFGLSIVLLALNAKNIPIFASVGASVAAADLSGADSTLAVIVLAVIASLSAATVVLVAIFGGDRSKVLLEHWRAWLVQNNATVMGVMFLVLGVLQLGKALESV